MNVATVLLNSDLNHDTLSLIGMRTKWHWCQARGASKAMIWWRPTRFPWFAGTEEWFLSSGGSWSPKSCHRLVSETIEIVWWTMNIYSDEQWWHGKTKSPPAHPSWQEPQWPQERWASGTQMAWNHLRCHEWKARAVYVVAMHMMLEYGIKDLRYYLIVWISLKCADNDTWS